MIKIWSLSKPIAGIPYELGAFTHKEDAEKLQEGFNNMYYENLKLEEKIVYDSIFEINIDEV